MASEVQGPWLDQSLMSLDWLSALGPVVCLETIRKMIRYKSTILTSVYICRVENDATHHPVHQSSTAGRGHQYHSLSVSVSFRGCKTLAAVPSAERLPLQGTPSAASAWR